MSLLKRICILQNKLENIECITDHKDFDTLILNKNVLETAFIKHRCSKNNFKEFNMSSKYVQLNIWTLYFSSSLQI